MKKRILILFMLVLGIVTYSDNFTFANYKLNSVMKYAVEDKKISSKFSMPILEEDGSASRKINRTLEKFKENYMKSANTVTYEITTKNNAVFSILFTVKNDEKTEYIPFNFNLETGDELKLTDLFLDGFEQSLGQAINARIKVLGLVVNDKYKGLTSKTKFILENEMIDFIFTKEDGSTNFGDNIIFVPFYIAELNGILK